MFAAFGTQPGASRVARRAMSQADRSGMSEVPQTEPKESSRHQRNLAPVGRSHEGEQKPRALAETEPKPRVKKSRKRMARAEQSEKGRRKTSYGVKSESEE